MTAARFVAYVYPGWHRSRYRPNVDEWQLLARFKPYFEGHVPPPSPADGPYDDADPATAARQIELARSAGIEAFTYFTYYGPSGFVMETPMELAFDAGALDAFAIGGTLCIRLPHDRFPVPPRDELEIPRATVTADTPLADRPIELLTLRDLTTLLGPQALEWTAIVLDRRPPAATVRAASPAAVAAAPGGPDNDASITQSRRR